MLILADTLLLSFDLNVSLWFPSPMLFLLCGLICSIKKWLEFIVVTVLIEQSLHPNQRLRQLIKAGTVIECVRCCNFFCWNENLPTFQSLWSEEVFPPSQRAAAQKTDLLALSGKIENRNGSEVNTQHWKALIQKQSERDVFPKMSGLLHYWWDYGSVNRS